MQFRGDVGSRSVGQLKILMIGEGRKQGANCNPYTLSSLQYAPGFKLKELLILWIVDPKDPDIKGFGLKAMTFDRGWHNLCKIYRHQEAKA